MNNRKDALDAFNRLLDIMDELRERSKPCNPLET